jgi:hypothetical protein
MNTNNNRPQNNNNRRRGRNNNNNNRQQNNNRSGFDYNNSIDNRARGNAAQMLEKYKKLAQDAQFNGDRVNAEYHLQFADHYFRVLADFRSENRDDWRDQNAESGYDDMDAGDQRERDTESEAVSDEREEQPRRESREERPPRRNDRNERGNRERGDRDGNRSPRRHHSEEAADEPAGLDLAVLPPSIALANDDYAEAEEAKPARKPRARRPKSANDEETVTAAE